MDQYRKWYHDNISQKIKERSWAYSGVPGRYIDIVNDVINVVAVHWVSDKIVSAVEINFCFSVLIMPSLVRNSSKDQRQSHGIVHRAGGI